MSSLTNLIKNMYFSRQTLMPHQYKFTVTLILAQFFKYFSNETLYGFKQFPTYPIDLNPLTEWNQAGLKFFNACLIVVYLLFGIDVILFLLCFSAYLISSFSSSYDDEFNVKLNYIQPYLPRRFICARNCHLSMRCTLPLLLIVNPLAL